MNKYASKFIKQTLVILAFSILFVAWQTNQNPEGLFMHYFFGATLLTVGILVNGILAILSAIEDKEKDEDEDEDENKKQLLKG